MEENPHVIENWTVENFKSIKYASFDLTSLNILVGTNSSGKSSLIQSLLFASQSVTQNDITLNGPLLALGKASETLHHNENEAKFTAAVRIDNKEDGDLYHMSYTFHSPDGLDLALKEICVSKGKSNVFRASTENIKNKTDLDYIKAEFGGSPVEILHVKIAGPAKPLSRTYIVLRGLNPVGIYRHSDENVHRKLLKANYPYELLKSDSEALTELYFSLRYRLDESDYFPFTNDGPKGLQGDELVRETMDELSKITRPTPPRKELSRQLYDQIIKALTGMQVRKAWIDYPMYQFEGPDYTRRRYQLLGGWPYAPYLPEEEESFRAFAACASAVVNTLRSVRYLGPLRDQPRVVHNEYNVSVPNLPTGRRGEGSAQLLHNYGKREIAYRDPEGHLRNETLSQSITTWIDYLGIAEGIRTIDQGKLGRGLEIDLGQHKRDLTAVGVGASQLLPIVISFLQASPGSVYIVEQPELHLHPAVQARLADFFLIAKPDVRAIIETHSEYLVTRTRRRIAEEIATPDSTGIYFVDQENGSSRYERISVNSYGDLGSWPRGFFDEQEKDLTAILLASAKRRKRLG
ncbi:DUF3696 domain-containing protein [uncultured Kocuria sp.]|uniref:AAA family ATPase n=1 Tax=uncultured Kocuria sp. TaxID=259305 RepID=UPI00263314C5|nr:DUF3696 domain-containing protein [uncultured Kocuria sp.]